MTALRFVNVGYGNMMADRHVVAIISPNSAPVKRLKDEARGAGRLVDVTQGRRTRSLVITASNHVFLTSVQVETLAARFQQLQSEPGHIQPTVAEILS